jgi:L-amino acid N-acyltransferase YncA
MRKSTEGTLRGITIRALEGAGRSEAPSIALLRASAWSGAASEDEVRNAAGALAKEIAGLDPQTKVLLVAKKGEAVVGFARVMRDRKDVTQWWLAGIDVHQAERRRGIGRALVSEGIAHARAKGCSLFRSETHVENETSILFHERIGFKNNGRFTAPDGDEKIAFSLPPDDFDALLRVATRSR